MELKDINRVMVKRGIKALNRSKRPAFQAIKEYYDKSLFTVDDISFLIAPLINSSGRMEDAMYSYEFLKSKTLKEALDRLEYIVGLNNERKDEERLLFEESLAHLEENENIIIAWGKEWHEGIVGIVASRLSKRFKKPAIVFSINNGQAKGSARGVGDINILSLIEAQSDILLGFGGHKGAAGVSIEIDKLEEFRDRMFRALKKGSSAH